jgi:general secretion pathway protein A
MYCEFYQLSERPFNVTPDPKFLYLNARYREAVAALQYGITQRKGFITLIGEAGTGKTTLLKRLLDELDASTRTVFLFNTNVTFEEILEYIFAEFDLPVHSGKKLYMLQRLNTFLLEELAQGRNVALLIDEAQDLDIAVLEDLRLLSNLETAKEKILQIVLSGQPELGQKLSNPALRQLRQRIGINCRLLPLSRDEVSEYIQYRLQAAGAPDLKLFTRDAEDQIYHFSRGIPRLVNVVCDNALVIGYALGKRRIGADIIKEAAADLLPLESGESAALVSGAEREGASHATPSVSSGTESSRSWRKMFLGAGLVACVGVGAWVFSAYRMGSEDSTVALKEEHPPTAEVIEPGSLREPLPSTDLARPRRAPDTEAPGQAGERPRLAMIDDLPPPAAALDSAARAGTARGNEASGSEAVPDAAGSGGTALEQLEQERGVPVAAQVLEEKPTGAPEGLPGEAKSAGTERVLGGRSTAVSAAEEEAQPRPAGAVRAVGDAREGTNEAGVAVADAAVEPVAPVDSGQTAARAGVWGGQHFSRFVIREGDSLSAIARAKYGQSSYTILDLIKLANPELMDVDRISPGQSLRLPDLSEGLPILRAEDGYALLVLSTPNAQRAQQLASALRRRGFEPRVTVASLGSQKKVHRVSVQAGRTQDEAAEVGLALRRLLREDARIVQLGQ